MYLHKNKKLFQYIINLCQDISGINDIFIEKDYYIFILLRDIQSKDKEIMFKGGTSLSKAWGVISRFSEDIDLNLRPDVESTDGHRKKMNYAIYDQIVSAGFKYDKQLMAQRKEYNIYDFDLQMMNRDAGINKNMRIEAMANRKGKILNATYTVKTIQNYVYDILCNDPQYQGLISECALEPFGIPVQNMDVTFVEKQISLTNNYIKGKQYRVSRHLYDIYQMWYKGDLSRYDLNACMQLTKMYLLERDNDVCFRQSVNARTNLVQALMSDFYRQDYNDITLRMITDVNSMIPYESCRDLMLGILSNMIDF